MKITDVKPILTMPSDYHASVGRTWTFVRVDTDEGISGIGEATNYPGGGSLISAAQSGRSGTLPCPSTRVIVVGA